VTTEQAHLSIRLRMSVAAACRRRLLEEGLPIHVEEFQAELALIDPCGAPRLQAQFEE
jgi:hypothetical protein